MLFGPAFLTLKEDEIEGRRRPRDRGQEAMGLSSMMCLVIEEMIQCFAQPLLDLRRLGDRGIAEACRKCRIVESFDIGLDAPILELARPPKLGKIVEQNGIEPGRRLALARESAHPDAVADEEMVQRAVERFEERTAVGSVVVILDERGGIVEAPVGPAVIGGEAPIAVLHDALLDGG
jgi:hypothetical protein